MRLIVHIRDLLLLILAAVYLLSWNINSSFSNEADNHTHKTEDCSSCHVLVASINDNNIPVMQIDRECRSCHEARMAGNVKNMLGFHNDSKRSCRECHSFHNPRNLMAGSRTFQMSEMTDNLLAICQSCHNEQTSLYNLSDAHKEASRIYHSDTKYLKHLSPSEACMACHSKTNMAGFKTLTDFEESQFESPPILFKYSSHPFGIEFDINSLDFPISAEHQQKLENLNLPNGKIECQTCHQIAVKNEHSDQEKLQICQTCHPEK